jgi:hypothetical protein
VVVLTVDDPVPELVLQRLKNAINADEVDSIRL